MEWHAWYVHAESSYAYVNQWKFHNFEIVWLLFPNYFSCQKVHYPEPIASNRQLIQFVMSIHGSLISVTRTLHLIRLPRCRPLPSLITCCKSYSFTTMWSSFTCKTDMKDSTTKCVYITDTLNWRINWNHANHLSSAFAINTGFLY